jgi:hypothetical protein
MLLRYVPDSGIALKPKKGGFMPTDSGAEFNLFAGLIAMCTSVTYWKQGIPIMNVFRGGAASLS